jgi:hypothetical protein
MLINQSGIACDYKKTKGQLKLQLTDYSTYKVRKSHVLH